MGSTGQGGGSGRRAAKRSIYRLILTGAAAIVFAAAAGFSVMRYGPLLIERTTATADAAPAPSMPPAAPVKKVPQAQPAPAAPVQLVQAAEPTKTITTTSKHGGWTVTCNQSGESAPRTCSANFRVVAKENNANILVWVIGFNAKGALLSEFLTLTDVQIQPGVAVTLDDSTSLKADYVECGTRGCKARIEITPDMIRSMKAATKATVAMTRLDGQVLQFQMEIPGIGEAMAELGV